MKPFTLSLKIVWPHFSGELFRWNRNAKEAEKSGKEQATTRFNANAEQEKNLITVAANKVQEANQFVLRANIFKYLALYRAAVTKEVLLIFFQLQLW